MKFRQIGLHVINLDRAIDFYKKVLQKEPIARFDPPGFAFFDLSGIRLFLDVNAPKSAVYLEVSDVKSEIPRIRALNVKIINEPHIVFPDPQGLFDIPGNEWLAFFEDSEGNAVGIMSRETINESRGENK
jgi:methylmalonyl-CoA/ethylmalonyl-CoA epimerase